VGETGYILTPEKKKGNMGWCSKRKNCGNGGSRNSLHEQGPTSRTLLTEHFFQGFCSLMDQLIRLIVNFLRIS
jgi:hypothetical protein